ncbi:type II secretion system protein [Anaerocolumna jejuensis]|uniref:type II secretion system protein n=1 Tax=Anaerocolumna jejuensis TaxID=259063 RepID=UPI003F7C1E87
MEKVNRMIPVQETEEKEKNKGFSLVELIVVIAIMAILVGIVGTQVLPYMEKSRKAKDMQVVSAVCTAAVTAFSEHAGELGDAANYTYTYSNVNDPAETAVGSITSELKTLLGVADGTRLFPGYFGGPTATKLDSKEGKKADAVVIKYDTATGVVSVQLKSGVNDILDPVKSK